MDAEAAAGAQERPCALIVISDLHIGAGALDDFDASIELEFVAFIGDVTRRAEPVELVINGDFLEFVQAEPWEEADLRSETKDGEQQLCFTEAQSVAKFRKIAEHHPNVFKALGWFLSEPANRLVILPGNHDADLFWPDVRDRLRAALDEAAGAAVGDRLVLHLGRVYRPPQMQSVWIEHGHQHDTNNRFYFADGECWSEAKPPIVQVENEDSRLLACTGTRFLCDYLNKLDETYPFVDNVKPFSKFVKMFLVGSALFRFGTPVRVAIAAWGIIRFLATTRKISALLSAAGQEMPSVAEAVRQAWQALPEARQDEFLDALTDRGLKIHMPIPDLLAQEASAGRILDAMAENFDLVVSLFPPPPKGLLSADGAPGTLGFVGGFVADESRELREAAESLIRYSGAKVVIMGHTHEPQDRPNGLNYVNTGSWTRYLRVAEEEVEPSSWSLLEPEAIAHFPYKLLFAEIHPANPDEVRLKTWRAAS